MRFNLYPRVTFIVLAFLLSGTAAKAQAQLKTAPPSSAAVQPPILLDVVVTDRAGNPIPGLKQSDFTVLDDKRPQAITSFREAVGGGPHADPPVQAVVLVDGINNSHHHLELLKEQLADFLRKYSELPFPFSLDFITLHSQTQTEPTRDGKALLGPLNSAQFGLNPVQTDEQFHAFRQELAELVRKEATIPGRKLLISLGPGWRQMTAAIESPSGGSDGFVVQNVAWVPGGAEEYLSDKRNKIIFDDVIWMSATLRQSRITFYSVDLPETMLNADSFRQFTKGATAPQNASTAQIAFPEVLAVLTGGQVLNRSNDVAESIRRCILDANFYYTLTFQPAAGSPSGQYHGLEVKVDKPGLTARTRTRYYSGPDSEEGGLAPFQNFKFR